MTDNELYPFLEARLAEDEAIARDAFGGRGDDGVWSNILEADELLEEPAQETPRITGLAITIYDEGGHDECQATHIAAWDPARVLAETAAKRAVLEAADYSTRFLAEGPNDVLIQDDWARANGRAAGLHRAVVLLAVAYSTHPDYRPEWTPR